MRSKSFLALALAGTVCGTATLAQDAPEAARVTLFAEVVSKEQGCQVDNLSPSESFVAAMETHGFDKTETKAIAQVLIGKGDATYADPIFTLTTGECGS
ncbi:hypothetical protein ACM25N_02070 [Roseovarius sp. C7]|uniref:hypothetical protein n=1 Tax=Roseovarius sp. C7 TaxID=3398643 RepID=UPI0039F56101